MSNFEVIARYSRYQRFAYESLSQGINALFLGHHLSDQVETVVLRMIRSQGVAFAGAKGMMPVNNIPCCENIFGARDGLKSLPISDLLGHRSNSSSNSPKLDGLSATFPPAPYDPLPGHIPISFGGIKVYRPLLSFPKSRLIATCNASRVPFVTDPSNFDPKTNERNAVRWLLSSNKLPAAFRQDSVLRIRDAAAQVHEYRHAKLVKLLEATQLLQLDIRSSRLLLMVPKAIAYTYDVTEREVAYYVNSLLHLVNTQTGRNLPSAERVNIARWIFPELRMDVTTRSDLPLDLDACTASDVYMKRATRGSCRLWSFSRRPFNSHPLEEINFAPVHQSAKVIDRGWSRWVLWDGRFWVRIRSHDANEIGKFSIRNLRPPDREEQQNLSSQALNILTGALRDAAPGKIRYTLPVIVKGGEVRAFPSLDIGIASRDIVRGLGDTVLTDDLRWEIRYKDISETVQHLHIAANNSGAFSRYRSMERFGPASNTDLLDGGLVQDTPPARRLMGPDNAVY